MFRALGSVVEMGYCFGVDYIVVYRSAPDGDQLLGNSSAEDTPVTPPTDFQGRIHISKQLHLLGLQISNLRHMDSGIYRRECWQNQQLVSQHTQELSVCDEEVEEEIFVKEQEGRVELLCNSTSIGLEGTFVRWYHEVYPSYKLTLFLDSSVSLDPLIKEPQSMAEVRNSGALLLLDNSLLKNNQHFYCLVIKGNNCLSFLNVHLPDQSESRDIFASQGDRVVLNCASDGSDQVWETPLGKINGNSVKNNQMYISFDDKSKDFSLIIPAVSDELSGDYSCTSSSLDVQYSLILCPKEEFQEKAAFEDGHVSLKCDAGEDESQKVQWYRIEPSGDHELILDSKDETVPIPDDLTGRLTLHKNGSSLTISRLKVNDQGVYSCVVLGGPMLLEEDIYDDDYTGEDAEEDDFIDDQYWPDLHRCISKQKIILTVMKKTRGGINLGPMTFKPEDRNPKDDTTAGPSAATNVTAYAVGAGVVGLLVVGVIVAVIGMKRRAKASSRSRQAPSHSGGNTSKDIKMNEDPGCTQSLTHNDEHCA